MAGVVLVTVLIVGVFMLHSQVQSLPTFLESGIVSHYNSIPENLTIFERGNYKEIKTIQLRKYELSAPEPLLIVSPEKARLYPVFLFIHGTAINPKAYTQLFEHIASHGFIVVAPKLFSISLPSPQAEINMATTVANWLPSNLDQVLQKHVGKQVKGDFDKLAISGHSRGGNTAFAVTLGSYSKKPKLTANISALIGVDPVAGFSRYLCFDPCILTFKPNSLYLTIPVTVIGTGLGNHTTISSPFIACAPNEVNHQEFYDECKESSHFVIMDYGHMQMLNDHLDLLTLLLARMCASGNGSKDIMRRTLGGIIVGFLSKVYSGPEADQYDAIVADKFLARPTPVSVEHKGHLGPLHAQI